jgi:GcrA cell cycle regulator
MRVHPLFDINAGVWATENGVTARTLAELQHKLPGATIEGYYPNGYEVQREGFLQEAVTDNGFARAALRTNHNGYSKAASRQITVRQVSRKLKSAPTLAPAVNWKDEKIKAKLKRLVAAGQFASQIAVQLGTTKNAVVSACNRFGFQLKQSPGCSMPSLKFHGPREGAVSD